MKNMNSQYSGRQESGQARRSGGYLLFEVAVGIAIASILIGAFYQISTTIAENRRMGKTEEGFVLISEALYNYRMQEREWPTALNDLASYAPNLSSGLLNGFGQPYTLTLTAAANDLIAPIRINTQLPTEDIAENIVREFYGRGTRTGSQISVEVPIPGHEPAREALLARDGTRDMDGDLDMDNFDLDDVGQINTNTLAATTNINVAGNTIDGSRVNFLNQIARLNCSGDQRVMISGGTAKCETVQADSGGGNGGTSSGLCTGESPGDCNCPGDLNCGMGYTGCYCYCANQCGK